MRISDWSSDVCSSDLYREQAPHGERAHPTEEHYLPLLVAIGASDAHEPGQLIRGGMTYGVLSMDSFGFGLSPDAPAEAACAPPRARACRPTGRSRPAPRVRRDRKSTRLHPRH